jgi:hypothetical protein
MSKPNEMNKSVAFNQISSPFYFFTNDDKPDERMPIVNNAMPADNEAQSSLVVNHAKKSKPVSRTKDKPVTSTPVADYHNTVADFINVNYAPIIVPQLKEDQEAQVLKAIEASKKVIESVQWKALEKKLAEVYTQQQKAELKSVYKAKIDKLNWNKLEDNLRIAYDKIDWDQVNTQLHTAIAQIALDSLKTVLNAEASQLNRVQEELSANKLTGIPDTDITLKDVEQKKQEVNKTLNTLRIFKTKKVVHL